MAKTFYFYDLETTGFNSRQGRIMQFGGQRTDLSLKTIGKPDKFYVKITEDILPDPGAVLVTGITPQKTLAEGISESEFAKYFNDQIAAPDTIFVGFNTIRFDDEFVRHLLYRNFYDPYEWQWQDGRSKWDLLDVARMTRALRPGGIKWPFDSSGAPSNQLGLLTSINNLYHLSAHDALSDVEATMALARLINTKQPKLFEFLLSMRLKGKVAELVNTNEPFVYTSGKYPSQYEKTTVVISLAEHPKQGAIVYDLRSDPTPYTKLKPAELAAAWRRRDPAEGPILPIKTLKFNRCPAVAPLSVLDKDSQTRLQIDMAQIEANAQSLKQIKDWPKNLMVALEILDKQQQERLLPDAQDVDNQLYDGFFSGADKQAMSLVRAAEPSELSQLLPSLSDNRLKALLPLYKARNYPRLLSPQELSDWHQYCFQRLQAGNKDSRLDMYFKNIEELRAQSHTTPEQKTILDELKLYGQSLLGG